MRAGWRAVLAVLVAAVLTTGAVVPAAAVGGFTVSGQVTLGDGTTPVTADAVQLLVLKPGAAAGTWAQQQELVVPAGGAYEFSVPAGSYLLRFRPLVPGFQAQWWGGAQEQSAATPLVVADSITGVNVALRTFGSVAGTVRLKGGAVPAAGSVNVSAQHCTQDGCASIAAVKTDSAGAFVLTDLADADYTLYFSYSARGPYYLDQTRTVTISAANPSANGVAVTLLPGPTIAGTVYLGTKATTATAGQVRVDVYDEGTVVATTTTTAAGTFVTPPLRPSDSWPYMVRFTSVTAGNYADQWYSNSDRQSRSTRIFLALGGRSGTNAVLRPGGTISGTIRDSKGLPQAGVVVTTQVDDYGVPGAASTLYSTTTNSAGAYSFTNLLPATEYKVAFASWSRGYWSTAPNQPWRWSPVTVRAGATTTANMTMYKSATVTVPNGCIPTCAASGFGAVVRPFLEIAEGADWVDVPFSRNSDGTTFGELAPGTYRVRLVLDAPADAKDVTFANRITSTFTVTEGSSTTISDKLVRQPRRDIDADGITDILVRNPSGSLLLVPAAGGRAQAPRTLATGWGSFVDVIQVGLFNNQLPRADVVARDSAGQLFLYLGAGTAEKPALGQRFLLKSGIASWTALTAGNFNSDGKPDILGRDAAGTVWMLPSNGTSVGAAVKVVTGWKSMRFMFSPGDFNSDGKGDLIALDAAGALWLYPGNGTGGLLARVAIAGTWSSYATLSPGGDLNGDGNMDLLATAKNGTVTMFPGNGKGAVGKGSTLATGWGSYRIAG